MLTRNLLFALLLTITLSLAVLAQHNNASSDSKARAEEVLKQARAAIWDETKSKPLKSLSISATTHRSRGGNEIATDTTVDILLPDKFLRTDLSHFGVGSELANIRAINGDQTWFDVKLSGGGPIGLGGGMAPPPPGPPGNENGRSNLDPSFTGGGGAPDGGMLTQISQTSAADLDRLLLSWLLIAPASLHAEFNYVGEAKVEGKTVDVIEVTSAGDFKARLSIDQQTHQVLQLSHTIKVPRMNFNRGQQGQNRNRQLTQEEREKLREEARARAAEGDLREVEIRWLISDYRNENGLNLPHHIAKSVGSQVYEQVEVKQVKINPSLKSDKFVRK